MRRLTILLAAVAMGALLVAPAAQAETGVEPLKVQLKGTGAGEAFIAPGGEQYRGSPEIKCSYKSPGPQTGVCETKMSDEGEGWEQVYVTAKAAAGSKFVGWTVNNTEFEGCGAFTTCAPYVEGPGEGSGEAEIIAEFVEVPTLTIVKEGTGGGTVVSSPSGISCGATCSASFSTNQKVTLTASPDSESLFVSWKGCETGGAIGRQCTVTMDKSKSVSAKFIRAYDVSVTRKGTGLGKVGSSPGGILCLSNCSSTSAQFKEATNVTLTAAPSKNFTFAGWSGDCSGTGTCVLSALSADKSVEAEFTAVPQHLLTVTKSGGGNGTVKAAQAGINCGATCTSMAAAYYQGTEVELTVTPGKGSSFGGWSTGAGTCTGTTNPCKVTMSSAKSVKAEFK